MTLSARARGGAPAIAAAAGALGIAAAVRYHELGLTLAHFDARAHLVVARRIFDNLIPGWQQVGAVWLPLPHLINAVPVQIDYFYRTGSFAVAVSIAAMVAAVWAIAALIHQSTLSSVGGVTAAALLMLDPNVLYLQSTPMSEPLLFGTTFVALALTSEWLDQSKRSDIRCAATIAPGWALVAAALSRFEAWPVIAALLALTAIATRLTHRDVPLRTVFVRVRGLALWPLWTVAAFLVNSRITVGRWFVDSGFFVPDNPALGHPYLAWIEVWRGLGELTGPILPWIGVAAAIAIVIEAVRRPRRAPLLLTLALGAAAILPWGAYFKGHPIRLRYDVPLVAACAAIVGTAVALLPRRLQLAAAALTIAVSVWQAPPFNSRAAVIAESQRDAADRVGRRAVTDYLVAHWDRQPIMMSMGSLAHYMQDLSDNGFDVRDFLHEGNGEIWRAAMEHPQPLVEWIAINEAGRGGDALSWRSKHDPSFLAGYARVAKGGGVALYRRR